MAKLLTQALLLPASIAVRYYPFASIRLYVPEASRPEIEKPWSIKQCIFTAMGIINDLGIIGLASRLDRLSEALKRDAILLYKENDLGKYKWYPVLYVIDKNAPIGVNEMAAELSFAHPSVIQTLHELELKKLIKSTADKKDSRRRLVSLTSKGKKFLDHLMPLVENFKVALAELVETDNNLLKALTEVEEQLQQESFYKRVKKIHRK